MSPGPTFDRVYVTLKEQLVGGRFGPGDHLEPSALGDELVASITPVRDALHRLVGERLVEAPRNDGFRVPSPTEAQLRGLYRWNGDLLDLALRRCRERPGIDDVEGALAHGGAPASLFRAIAGCAGNQEHELAIESLNERLGPLRAAEERLFQDWRDELETLRSAFAVFEVRILRRAIAAYHRRRQRSVPELLVLWQRLAGRT
jgi:hypothetical protein